MLLKKKVKENNQAKQQTNKNKIINLMKIEAKNQINLEEITKMVK